MTATSLHSSAHQVINTKAASEIAKLPEITAFSVELLHGYGGALSSEHGDGRARSWINERFFGPDLYTLYQEVKRAFDPHNILNPGAVVDALPMTGMTSGTRSCGARLGSRPGRAAVSGLSIVSLILSHSRDGLNGPRSGPDG